MKPMFDIKKSGNWIYSLIKELYPICRSITGQGVRDSLEVIAKNIPLDVKEIPTGTQVFDWTIPKEWNIRDAWIKDEKGKRLVDFKKSNLHVVSYSSPIHERFSLKKLIPHLHTLPDYPDWIPYRTSYYKENWGFCLSHNQFTQLKDENYEVCIDSSLTDGSLTYGECQINGKSEKEVIVSAHICHPSLCNDNLSGVCVAVALAKLIAMKQHRYTYRFIFAPGTIGAITWLALNKKRAQRIRHGLILSGVGDEGTLSYKRSIRGDAIIDRAVEHLFVNETKSYKIEDFSPYGYDERQYGSPGFKLPVGRISRTPFGTYPEYHTSADNMSFVKPECLEDTFEKIKILFNIIEENRRYINRKPFCEPQLGKRGLYESIGDNELAMLWVLNMSDGNNDLLDIAEKASISFSRIQKAALILQKHNLVEPC